MLFGILPTFLFGFDINGSHQRLQDSGEIICLKRSVQTSLIKKTGTKAKSKTPQYVILDYHHYYQPTYVKVGTNIYVLKLKKKKSVLFLF